MNKLFARHGAPEQERLVTNTLAQMSNQELTNTARRLFWELHEIHPQQAWELIDPISDSCQAAGKERDGNAA